MSTCSFEITAETDAQSPTLIEGLPGHGLVASIAVDHITDQLGLSPYGGIRSDEVPPVLSFTDGRAHDTVRVFAGTDPDVLTLHGDVMLPQQVHRAFSSCILSDLAEQISRGIFLAAAPAQSEEDHGDIIGVATDDEMQRALEDVGVELAQGDGLVGGVTGALVDACYHEGVPAALLLVRADPLVPDPKAAQLVIDEALEPMVDFDIETDTLLEQAQQIQEQKAQIAKQLQEQEAGSTPDSASVAGMYQ